MIKRTLALAALLLAIIQVGATEPMDGRLISITAATAIRVILNPATAAPVMANSITIQPLLASSGGVVYVLSAPPDVTCANGGAGTTFVQELTAATSTVPGSVYNFPINGSGTTQAGGFDVRYFCLDGAHTGDSVAVSWDVKR